MHPVYQPAAIVHWGQVQ